MVRRTTKRKRKKITDPPGTGENLARVVRAMKRWMNDKSGYEEEFWPKIKKAIDDERPEGYKVFDGLT